MLRVVHFLLNDVTSVSYIYIHIVMAETVPFKKQKPCVESRLKPVEFLEQVMGQMQTEMQFKRATIIYMSAAVVRQYRDSVEWMSARIHVQRFQIILRRLSGQIMH